MPNGLYQWHQHINVALILILHGIHKRNSWLIPQQDHSLQAKWDHTRFLTVKAWSPPYSRKNECPPSYLRRDTCYSVLEFNSKTHFKIRSYITWCHQTLEPLLTANYVASGEWHSLSLETFSTPTTYGISTHSFLLRVFNLNLNFCNTLENTMEI